MAIIDRDPVAPTAQPSAVGPDERAPEPVTVTPDAAPSAFTLSGAARVLLATASIAAGAIHLAMVPAHAAEWMVEGVAFALTGWVQVGLGIVAGVRPSRLALWAIAVTNVVFIGAWAVTRRSGWPVGPEAGIAHAASFVDLAAVGLEAVLVLAALVLLARPTLGSRLGDGGRVMLSVVPIAMVVLATLAITSPSAQSHGGSGGDGHTHGGAELTTASGDDKGLSQVMNGQGEGGGHSHSFVLQPVDFQTQEVLDAQLAKTKVLMEKYPTVAQAEAAGYHRMGPFSPGLGAHYMEANPHISSDTTVNDDSLAHPMLIYDGITPGAKLAGFMYTIYSLDTQKAPEGFAGPNDHWHYHTNVCITTRPDGGIDAPLGADTSATQALCDKYGGHLIENTGYMAHVWTVPGYESSQGMFSNVNPKITCPDGTYYVVAPEDVGNRSNICKDVPA